MMRLVSPLILSAITTCLMAVHVMGGSPAWILTTTSFARQPVDFLGSDEKGLTVQTGDAAPVLIPLGQFLRLQRIARRADSVPVAQPDPATQPVNTFVLELVDDSRYPGAPVLSDGDRLTWRSRAIGDIEIDLRSVRAIVRQPATDRVSTDSPVVPTRSTDELQLVNGDRLDGIVTDISPQTITVLSTGQSINVPLQSVAQINFSSLTSETDSSRQSRCLRLSLDDGTVINSPTVVCQEAQVRLVVDEVPRKLPLDRVDAIEQINGPMVWISDLTPKQSEQTPYLASSPSRMPAPTDRRPTDKTARHDKNIIVQSRSRLVYELPHGFSKLRVGYAMAGDRPLANVTVKIWLDERLVHQQEDVVAQQVNPPVQLDLNGARQLTLEVDYGKNFDVQDQLLWLEPALVR
ncbi:MAG: NPCBM/NEW2 domain-containing protein [Phycisphaerales bacterium]|nr:NPCBM/NEW2 domain-containing protein [Phycisphaerales bacterium]